MVQHVRLLIVTGGKNNVISNVFEGLLRNVNEKYDQEYLMELTALPLSSVSSLIEGVSQTL